MSTKHDSKCLENSQDDEPLFVLCARDPDAPGAVRDWANRASLRGVRQDKVSGARILAEDMDRWREEHPERAKGAAD